MVGRLLLGQKPETEKTALDAYGELKKEKKVKSASYAAFLLLKPNFLIITYFVPDHHYQIISTTESDISLADISFNT